MLVVESSVTRVPLQAGVARNKVVAILGEPRSSSMLDAVEAGDGAAGAVQVDVYRVSRLVQLPGDRYFYEANVYPACVILTAGLVEVVVLPVTLVDIGYKAIRRDDLWVVYDAGDEVISFERFGRMGGTFAPATQGRRGRVEWVGEE
ncbi:MAG TPA: hypothetical protein PKE55_08515 [Kiritimatiellia bacterium]|nr:hypothetical protein [Kiritimatiellia bacterium]